MTISDHPGTVTKRPRTEKMVPFLPVVQCWSFWKITIKKSYVAWGRIKTLFGAMYSDPQTRHRSAKHQGHSGSEVS